MGFLDRMIALVEGAERQKTPNEIALTILLVGLTIIFLIAVATIPGFATYAGGEVPVPLLAALADHAHSRRPSPPCCRRSASPAWTGWCASTCSPSPAARSRRRATSTCCCSTRPARSRSATARRANSGRWPASARASSPRRRYLASLADETPEGRSIVVLARERYAVKRNAAPRRCGDHPLHRADAAFGRADRTALPPEGRGRRGAEGHAGAGETPRRRRSCAASTDEIARAGGTPLAVVPGRPAARRDPPQGHRQGRHARAFRASCARWASAR